jgi:hypothetical protein
MYQLRILGITHRSVYPDLDGLAVDLKRFFRKEMEYQKCSISSNGVGQMNHKE